MNLLRKNLSLRISCQMLAVVFFISSAYAAYSSYRQEKSLFQILNRRAQTVADMIAFSSVDALIGSDFPHISTILEQAAARDASIAFLAVHKGKNTVSVYGERPIHPEPYLTLHSPIQVRAATGRQAWTVGDVEVWIHRAEIDGLLRNDRQMLLFTVLFFSLVMVSVLIFTVNRTVILPLRRLENFTQQVANHNFTVEATEEGPDEFGRLNASFRKMLADLRATTVSRDYVEDIMESLTEMLFVTAPDLKIETVNPAALTTLGLGDHQLLGRKLTEILELPASSGPLRDVETKVRRGDGRFLPVLISSADLKRTRGGAAERLFVLKDISMQKQNQALIEQQQVTLVQTAKMSALGEMAGGMAHEINNPLAAARLQLQLLKRDLNNPNQREAALAKCDRTLDILKRIEKIVRSLTLFSRDSNEDPFLPTSVRNIIDETLALTSERFKIASIGLITDVYLVNDKIECHATEISQVLVNLLSNAFDAVQSLPEKWVRIEARETGDTITIAVVDAGHGVPPEIAEKMMQPFFTTKEVGRGTGLGLSIAKGLIEAHHGHFGIDTKSAHTRFYLELPRLQPASVQSGSRPVSAEAIT